MYVVIFFFWFGFFIIVLVFAIFTHIAYCQEWHDFTIELP